ncbi:hypothetical protein D3C72_861360 [compost metagenome]
MTPPSPRILLALAMANALAGCGGPAPGGPTGGIGLGPSAGAGPQAVPTAPPSYSPYEPVDLANGAKSGISDAGVKLLGGSLAIEATDGAGPIAGMVVDVYGPTLATGVGSAAGKATMAPLSPGTGYTVVVRAPGFATLRQAGLEIKQKMTTTVRLALIPGATVAGRVTAGGAPVVGAVVSDGLNSALTGADGRYELAGVSPGAATLRVSKPRFVAAARQATLNAGGTAGVDLVLAPAEGALFFDTRLASGLDATRFAGLKQGLAAQGWKLVESPPPAPGDAWVLVCPAGAITADTMAKATSFVAQGGKLVMLGEWGGFGGFDNPAANALAHGMGLHFNPDLLREVSSGRAPERLAIAHFGAALQPGPQSVVFENACSLFGLSGMVPLASTGSSAYRVQAGTPDVRAVAMGGPYGAGKAIALGDTSGWSDVDADGDGKPDAAAADTMLFWEKLLAW